MFSQIWKHPIIPMAVDVGRFLGKYLIPYSWMVCDDISQDRNCFQPTESSRAEYKPNSLAILDFNGDWFNRFLYILERVPNVAVSKIIHASGLSPSKVFLSQLEWSIIYWRTKGSEFLSNSYFISSTKFVWNCWLLKREPSKYHNPVFVANESVVMNFVRNPTSRISDDLRSAHPWTGYT